MSRSIVAKLVERLKYININIELHGNYPWIYLYKVNGNKVKEKYLANHGFTAFILKRDSTYYTPDSKLLFKTIRKYI